MSTELPPPGGGTTFTQSQPNSMTSASGGDRRVDSTQRMRSFAEIQNYEILHRNIIEVKLMRSEVTLESGEKVKAKVLSDVDLSEFLFDILKLKMEDCEGIGQ